ncbi:MAG TPA: HAMP domain-containing sensor histidine kinase [Candidatus Nitrosotalea sp.]|nr:HAMP domain-containing sensor histidine kinase [Candidatus Nitrosotalea sp.]
MFLHLNWRRSWRSLALVLPPWTGAATSLGLIVTLLAAGTAGVLAAEYSRSAAERVAYLDRISGYYQQASESMAVQQDLSRRYQLERLPTLKTQFLVASGQFKADLGAISRSGSAADRSFVRSVSFDYSIYLAGSSRLLAAIDAQDTAAAFQIETGLDPVSGDINQLLDVATARRQAEATSTLSEVNRNEAVLGILVPVVVFVAILFAALLLVLLEANRLARNAKSSFLAKMSHELRTPLNAILGFGQMLEMAAPGSLSERQARYVNNIQTSGTHLLALIDDILDLSKVEARRMDLHPERFGLDGLLEELVREAEPLVKARGQSIRIERNEILWVVTDRRRLLQALLNGVSNAINFSGPGTSIELSGLRTAAGIEISVRDHGVGVAAQDLKRAFDEYARVGERLARDREGTGLGLPLSRSLVELLGGRLELESSPAGGTVFRVVLPSSLEAPPAPLLEAPATVLPQ